MIRQGEFSGSGLYAASNSFPENTSIRVENVQTGKSVQVTVVKRIEGAGNIFLLLSEQAGGQIGLSGSEVIRVRARVVSSIGASLEETLREQVYSSDPDLNPPLSVDEDLLRPASEEAIAAAGGSEAEAAGAAEAAAAAPAKSPEQKRLEEIANRVPQKDLYLPPRQQELYALAPPPEEVEEETAAAEVPSEEQQPEIVEELAEAPEESEGIAAAAEEEEPRVSMAVPSDEEQAVDVELPGPQTIEPEKPSPEGSRLPAPEGEGPLAMEPEVPPLMGEEQPLEEEATVAEEAETGEQLVMAETTQPAQAELALADSLPARTYFLQLGAYSTRGLAEKLAGELNQTYSVTILPATSDGSRFFKVLVGPLNGDESGTLLYQFRARGFKDAFIKFVE